LTSADNVIVVIATSELSLAPEIQQSGKQESFTLTMTMDQNDSTRKSLTYEQQAHSYHWYPK
ncbi:hypothetical protein L9F63_002536, partial [Diploptera punctata]